MADGASLIAQLVKNLPAIHETPVQFLGWEDPLEKRDRLPTPVFLGFLCGSAGKESACNAGDLDSIPGLGRSPSEGKGYLHQYLFGLENSMDCLVHGVALSHTWLSEFHFTSWLMMLNIFLDAYWLAIYISFLGGEMYINIFGPCFKLSYLSFNYWDIWVCYLFWILFPSLNIWFPNILPLFGFYAMYVFFSFYLHTVLGDKWVFIILIL